MTNTELLRSQDACKHSSTSLSAIRFHVFSCLWPLKVHAHYPGHTSVIWAVCLGQLDVIEKSVYTGLYLPIEPFKYIKTKL